MKYTASDIYTYLKKYYTPWVFETWAGRSIVYAVFIDKQGLLTPQYSGGMYKYEMCCDIPPEDETVLEFRAKHECLDYRPFYEICEALADQVDKPIEQHQARFLVDHYYKECIGLMDADIMDALDAAGYDNEYDFFAAYLIAHREKYGVDFIM